MSKTSLFAALALALLTGTPTQAMDPGDGWAENCPTPTSVLSVFRAKADELSQGVHTTMDLKSENGELRRWKAVDPSVRPNGCKALEVLDFAPLDTPPSKHVKSIFQTNQVFITPWPKNRACAVAFFDIDKKNPNYTVFLIEK